MEAKKQNEEVQSRRGFFKEAAKKALPVIGAIALASSPIIANAAESPMGCEHGCLNGCYTGCYTGCSGTCKETCVGGCKGSCWSACRDNCMSGNNR